MLSFEDKIASYVEKTDNHVLYRVTPIFIDDELVCRGVAMEGWSIEDSGVGICFNVFCYNVQPGVIIDYATGENCLDEAYIATSITTSTTVTTTTVTTTAPVSDIKLGDANCDGAVNLSDAVIIMQSISNPDRYGVNGTDPTHITEKGMKNGDVEGNNGITNKDALEIQKFMLGLITSFTSAE